jgi:hypothetical protein
MGALTMKVSLAELRNVIATMKAAPIRVARSRYQCPLCYRMVFGRIASCPSCGLPFEYEEEEPVEVGQVWRVKGTHGPLARVKVTSADTDGQGFRWVGFRESGWKRWKKTVWATPLHQFLKEYEREETDNA